MAQVIPVKISANAPSIEDVAALTNTIYTSTTSQESLDASYGLSDLLLSTVGFSGLVSYGILDNIKNAANDKKNGARREGAMFALGAILERFLPKYPVTEVTFLLQYPDIVPIALDALADKGATVKEGAQYALDALYSNLKPESMTAALLPVVVQYLGKRSGKWQGTVGAYNMITKMANKAKIGTGSFEEEKEKDVLREAMGKRLAGLIPTVEAGMHDLKPEVRLREAME